MKVCQSNIVAIDAWLAAVHWHLENTLVWINGIQFGHLLSMIFKNACEDGQLTTPVVAMALASANATWRHEVADDRVTTIYINSRVERRTIHDSRWEQLIHIIRNVWLLWMLGFDTIAGSTGSRRIERTVTHFLFWQSCSIQSTWSFSLIFARHSFRSVFGSNETQTESFDNDNWQLGIY